MRMSKHSILEATKLKKYFPIQTGLFRRTVGWVRAVDGVSLKIYQEETFGVVGESGCGKSTLGMTLLRLHEPSGGSIVFQGKDITRVGFSHLKKLRREFQMIFQDPFSSLNPRMRAGSIVEEGLRVHKISSARQRTKITRELLERVGLPPGSYRRFPHEFSGGQRQRVGIARALATHPLLIVADEAVSALDVSVRAQMLNLMLDLKKDFHLTYIFVSHDLSVVKSICNRIMVMYLGKGVEMTNTTKLFTKPLHPYTVALISAVPVPDPDYLMNRVILDGDVPSPVNPPPACRFHTRCPVKQDICEQEEPLLEEKEPGHFVACHYPGSLDLLEGGIRQ